MKAVSTKALILTFAVTALSVLATPDAHARERVVSGTVQGSRGHSGTFEDRINHTKGTTTSHGTWTNQRGTGTFDATRTQKADKSGWVNQRTQTNPNGRVWNSTRDATKTSSGYSITGKSVRDDGKTVTSNSQVTKTDTGHTVNTVYTGPNGNTRTANSQVTKTDTGHTVNTVSTGQNGKTTSRDAVYTNNGNGAWTKDVTKTGPNGKTHEWQQTGTIKVGK